MEGVSGERPPPGASPGTPRGARVAHGPDGESPGTVTVKKRKVLI